MWTRTEGKSRVVFLQLGHDRQAFDNPNFRDLVARSIRWAARRSGGTMTPRMATCGTFSVVGVASRIGRGSESPELFARIWKAFESRRQDIESVATQKTYFGVSLPTAMVQFDNRRAAFEEYPENTPEQPVHLYVPVRQHRARRDRAG